MSEGVVEANIAKEMEAEFKLLLQERFDESKEVEKAFITPFLGQEWKSLKKATAQDFIVSPQTGVSSDELQFVAKKIYDVPEVNKLFKKSQRLLSDRKKMFEERFF